MTVCFCITHSKILDLPLTVTAVQKPLNLNAKDGKFKASIFRIGFEFLTTGCHQIARIWTRIFTEFSGWHPGLHN